MPKLKIAPRVTRAHGEAFADGWRETVLDSGSMFEVFEDTGLVKWPGDNPNRPLGVFLNPRQYRYQDIEDEILKRVFDSVRPAVAEAFVKVARDVLARERERQK